MPHIPKMNGMNKMNNFFKVPEMSQNRLIWVGIDLQSVPAKFGSPGNSGYFGAKLGQKWSQAIVTVLDVPGPPNFAGTLVRSIPTQINRFWDISGTLKKLFIFVHSVHSGNLGPHFGLPNVRSSSHCTYQS